jgi:hypothetical protein
MKAFVGGMLEEAMKCVYKHEKALIQEFTDSPDLGKKFEAGGKIPMILSFINSFLIVFKERIIIEGEQPT